MDYDYNDRKQGSVYSKRLRAGKRRTYFFDVRETRGSDFYVTITETRKRFNDDGFERQKIFIYKEDFNKFATALGEAFTYVKTELMPDFDFDYYNHEDEREQPRYRAPKNRSGYANDSHHHSSATDQNTGDQKGAPNTGDHQKAPAETQPIEATEQDQAALAQSAQSEPKPAPPLEDHANMQAEPMHPAQPEEAKEDDTLINASPTADKLASEEVEKW